MTSPMMSPKLVEMPNDMPSCSLSSVVTMDVWYSSRVSTSASGTRGRDGVADVLGAHPGLHAHLHQVHAVHRHVGDLARQVDVRERIRRAERHQAPREAADADALPVQLAGAAHVDGAVLLALRVLEEDGVRLLEVARVATDDIPGRPQPRGALEANQRDRLRPSLGSASVPAANTRGWASSTPGVERAGARSRPASRRAAGAECWAGR